MTPLQVLFVAVLAVVATLASYISRVYSEFGKILSREVQENLDAWEVRIEPHLGLSREHAALCAAVLVQLSLGLIALEFGAILFGHAAQFGEARPGRDCASGSGRGAGGHLLQPADSVAALQPHARIVGGAAAVAHLRAAVAGDAGHGLHPLLLFRGGAGGSAGQSQRSPRPTWKR